MVNTSIKTKINTMKRKIGYLLLGALFASLLFAPAVASSQIRISNLPQLTVEPDSNDVMPIVNSGVTKRIQVKTLFTGCFQLCGFQEGSYSPTFTGKANITTINDSVCFYNKIGRLITVDCMFSNADADTGDVSVSINYPITPTVTNPSFSIVHGQTIGNILELEKNAPISGFFNFTTQKFVIHWKNEDASTYKDIRITFKYTID